MANDVKITDNSKQVIEAKDVAVLRVLEAIGLFLEGEAKEELENDPRRIDTGRLRNSISHKTIQSEEAVYIGTNVEYAPYVHYGTRKMKPNRFLINAVQRNAAQIKNYVKKELKGE